ncbi:SDR family NAD(P)-dependent oxidoreductase [Flavisphingomonas formosensis]|uniref:SDR family NAD(P)-dependent oxidoreductase n=1 Tax=Flavisphingomonas formosensis TaxID=861534 RepID=UPI0012FB1C4D|nr:SDR family NAD(P)-dependent oxidoreductase [Sphingomonas formosensis]
MAAGFDRLSLAGKVAIVTGGGNGIGAETACLMASRGAAVLIADIDEDAAWRTERQIADEGGRATALRVDVGSAADLQAMVDAAVDMFGGLHILCNNAFFQVIGSVEQLSEADWDRTQTVSLKSVFLGSKFAIPRIRASGGGAIVNTASMHAITGFRGFAAYQSAKGGVCALTRQMAMDYGHENIRVNAVLPGPTVTAAFAQVPESYVRISARRTPILRTGRPDETAEAIAFLASDAASLITGIAMPVDGGATIVGEPDWLDEKPVILA